MIMISCKMINDAALRMTKTVEFTGRFLSCNRQQRHIFTFYLHLQGNEYTDRGDHLIAKVRAAPTVKNVHPERADSFLKG